jgi:two-component system chemotaxis sensor kinase CheA
LKSQTSSQNPLLEGEVLETFINETKEHLESIEQGFLILENQKTPDQKVIDKIFRAVHSIKGSAGFMQLEKISRLAHIMETMLQKMRTGEIRPAPQYIDSLLSGRDLLSAMTENFRDSNQTDIEEVYGRISDLVKNSGRSPDSGQNLQQDASDPGHSETDTGTDAVQHEAIPDIDNDIIALFVSETKEHIETIEEDFLMLENQSASPDPELIGRLFRSVHSIKGSSGMLEFANISKLAHAMENLLQKIRSAEIHPETEFVEAMLASCDLLKEMTANIGKSEQIDIQKVRNRLTKLAETETDLTPPESGTEAEDTSYRVTVKNHEPVKSRSETVRIKVELLDLLMTLAGELVLVRNQHLSMINHPDPLARSISHRMDIVTTQLQEAVMRTRMQPVGSLFSRLPRIVRDLSKKIGKQIRLATAGEDVELDRTILESLSDPLTHIIRNACDHGIESPRERHRAGKPETGYISVRAYQEGGQINIVIQDDGSGIDPGIIKKTATEKGLKALNELDRMSEKDILSLIMMPGFTTSAASTEISGRGVGMDVVKSSVEAQGGSVEVLSETGEGTTIHLRLPLTLAIIPCLIIHAGNGRYAIPKISVDELVCLYDEEVFTGIEYAGTQEVCRLRNTLLPIVRMSEVLARPEKFTEEIRSEITEKYSRIAKAEMKKKGSLRRTLLFAVVRIGTRRFGLAADRVTGAEEIVVSPIHPKLKSLGIYAGTTIMGDGTIAFILDIQGIAEHARVEFIPEREDASESREESDEDIQRVLLFKSGEHEQFAVPLPLIRRVEHIAVSQIETVGTREYITIDGIPTLILRMDRLLSVSPCAEQKEMFLLLPRYAIRPFGILMSRLLDTVPVPLSLNEKSYVEDGILGTAVVQSRMTLFPDIYRLFEKAEPERQPQGEIYGPSPEPVYKVLLIEDTVFFRRLVKGYLESGGYETDTAENGLKGLELIDHTDYDLIVSDIEMPEMDGCTFIKDLRTLEKYKKIPAVALTTLDSPEDRERIKRVGFNAYEKKIDRERLLATVNRLLQRKI